MKVKNQWIIQQVKVHFNAIDGLNPALMQTDNQQAVHETRVRIKKMRALLRVLNHPHKTRLPKKIQNLYAIAGKVREHQLLLQHYESRKMSIPKELAQQQGFIYFYQIWLERACHKLNIRKQVKKIVVQHKGSQKQTNLLSFVEACSQKLVDLLGEIDTLDDEGYHDMRKILKDLQYIVQFLMETGSEEGKTTLQPFHQQLVEITEPLGKFQDVCNLLALTNIGFIETLPEEEKSQLEAEKKALLKAKATMRKKLATKLLGTSVLVSDLVKTLESEGEQG